MKRYQGTRQFGRAYQVMLENDANAPGSVDRVLCEQMIRLCPETREYLYAQYTPTRVCYEVGSRPELEQYATRATRAARSDEEKVAGIAAFCASLTESCADDLDEMRVGGTEEKIIRRGSEWCTEIARVGCILSQIGGLPARLAYLFDTAAAYSGHAIIEVFRGGAWGAVCPETNTIYRHPDDRPASTWDLQHSAALVEAHRRGDGPVYTTPAQFRGAAISNYFVSDWRGYQYPVTGLNQYYRSILTMSLQGWPGGLRWLYGENAEQPVPR